MSFDMETIESSLAKAKADVEFWESAKRVLSDPRISGLVRGETAPFSGSAYRAYGDVRRAVIKHLPHFGTQPTTTTDLISNMEVGGYVFTAKQPTVAVNDALVGMEKQGLAVCVGRAGISKLWTKTESTNELNLTASKTDSGAN